MTTYSTGEGFGSRAFTWAIIAVVGLLLVEVTWPQAMSVAPTSVASVQTVTVAAHPERLARAQ